MYLYWEFQFTYFTESITKQKFLLLFIILSAIWDSKQKMSWQGHLSFDYIIYIYIYIDDTECNFLKMSFSTTLNNKYAYSIAKVMVRKAITISSSLNTSARWGTVEVCIFWCTSFNTLSSFHARRQTKGIK